MDRTLLERTDFSRDDLVALLALDDPADLRALHDAAYAVKVEHVGRTVHFRGIVEFSNICAKDCHYCGIRRSNRDVERFRMSCDEIVEGAVWAHGEGYGSIVLQSGERRDKDFVDFVSEVLERVHDETGGELGVTLSLGCLLYTSPSPRDPE